jgi:hypothetical protein
MYSENPVVPLNNRGADLLEINAFLPRAKERHQHDRIVHSGISERVQVPLAPSPSGCGPLEKVRESVQKP